MLLELAQSLSYSYSSPVTGKRYFLRKGVACDVDSSDLEHITRGTAVIPFTRDEEEVLRHARKGNFQFQRYAIENELPLIPSDLSNQKVVLVRAGGIGDILFLGPVVSELKKRGAKVALATAQQHAPLASLISGVDGVVSAVRVVADDYDLVLKMQGVIEANPLAENLHAVECCLQWLGLNSDERVARLNITEEMKQWAKGWFKKKGFDPLKTIAVHTRASSPLRSWRKSRTLELIDKLVSCGFNVVFFDNIRVGMKPNKRIANLSARTSILQTTSLIESVCLLVCIDSGLLHIAGCLGTPLLMLAAPFNPRLRICYYDKYVALWGKSKCAPCFSHSPSLCKHMDEKRIPLCMDRITVERVLEEVKGVIGNYDYKWNRIYEV